jgi:hypothetical protein
MGFRNTSLRLHRSFVLRPVTAEDMTRWHKYTFARDLKEGGILSWLVGTGVVLLLVAFLGGLRLGCGLAGGGALFGPTDPEEHDDDRNPEIEDLVPSPVVGKDESGQVWHESGE